MKMKKLRKMLAIGFMLGAQIFPMVSYAETVDNGKMWWSTDYMDDGNNSYNIKGYPNGRFSETTFSDDGYTTVLSVGGGDPIVLGRFGKNGGTTAYGPFIITQTFSFISGGNYVKVEYKVKNNGSTDRTFSLGSYADIEIDGDDFAPIESLPGNRGIRLYSGNAQFMFIARDSYGVTNADTYWLGNYQLRKDRVFTDRPNYESASGRPGDSAMAYSWKNRYISAGETQTYSVLFGVGELNNPPTIAVTSPTKNLYYAGETVSLSGNVSDQDRSDTIRIKYAVDGGNENTLNGQYYPNGGTVPFSGISFTIPKGLSAGQHWFDVWAVDDKGNMSPSKRVYFEVGSDVTAPTGSYWLNPSGWTKGSVTINVTATDTQSGVYRIKLPNGQYVNSANASYSVSSNGTYTFILEDNVGNVRTYSVPVSNIDTTAPTATHTLNPSGWTNGNVSINVSASDSQSGVKRIKLPGGNYVNSANTSYTVGGNGTYSFVLEDNLGNVRTYNASVSNIDRTAPANPVVNANQNWTNASSVPVTISGGTDVNPGAGLSYYQYKLSGATTLGWTNYGGQFNIANEGVTTITARAVDKVGNISGETSVTIRIDRTVPHNTGVTINNNVEYTNSRNVNLSLRASDNASGVIKMQIRNDNGSWSTEENYATSKAWTLNTGDGTRTVRTRFKDLAGNWSSEVTDTIKLDTTAPTISKFIVQGGRQYYNSNTVNIEFSATDSLSGIKEMYVSNDGTNWTKMTYTENFSWNLTAGDGNKTIYIKLLDIAGNMSDQVSRGIVIDTVKPTGKILINDGDEQTMSRDVKLKLTFSDDRSGINSVKVTEDGSEYSFPQTPNSPTIIDWRLSQGTGLKTVHMVLVDKAGNVSNPISDSIVVDKIAIERFTLTDVVNPTVFNRDNRFRPVSWEFAPQSMVAGGNVSFAINLKRPYDPSVVQDTVTYKVEISNGSEYNKVLAGTMNKQSIIDYTKTIALPGDAPKGAKVHVIVTAKRDLLVPPYDTQTVYFPGEEATTKAQIGEITGNIHEQVKFNERF